MDTLYWLFEHVLNIYTKIMWRRRRIVLKNCNTQEESDKNCFQLGTFNNRFGWHDRLLLPMAVKSTWLSLYALRPSVDHSFLLC